jgi:hypothetical protein
MRSAAAYPQCGQVIIETDLMTPILDTMPIGLFTVEITAGAAGFAIGAPVYSLKIFSYSGSQIILRESMGHRSRLGSAAPQR